MKQCSRCKEWKSESDFSKNKARPGGLSEYCRKCFSDYKKEYRKQPSVKEKEAKYSKEHADREKNYLYQRSDKYLNYIYHRRRTEEARQYYVDYMREHRKKPEVKAKINEYKRRTFQRDKIKFSARYAVQKQVREGKMPPVKSLKCARCDRQAQGYHHYLGYEKEHWLDIEPLCARCHKEADS